MNNIRNGGGLSRRVALQLGAGAAGGLVVPGLFADLARAAEAPLGT